MTHHLDAAGVDHLALAQQALADSVHAPVGPDEARHLAVASAYALVAIATALTDLATADIDSEV